MNGWKFTLLDECSHFFLVPNKQSLCGNVVLLANPNYASATTTKYCSECLRAYRQRYGKNYIVPAQYTENNQDIQIIPENT